MSWLVPACGAGGAPVKGATAMELGAEKTAAPEVFFVTRITSSASWFPDPASTYPVALESISWAGAGGQFPPGSTACVPLASVAGQLEPAGGLAYQATSGPL